MYGGIERRRRLNVVQKNDIKKKTPGCIGESLKSHCIMGPPLTKVDR